MEVVPLHMYNVLNVCIMCGLLYCVIGAPFVRSVDFMPWLCVDYMIQQGVWPMGFLYTDPLAIQTHWQNPDPLVGTQSSSHCNM